MLAKSSFDLIRSKINQLLKKLICTELMIEQNADEIISY